MPSLGRLDVSPGEGPAGVGVLVGLGFLVGSGVWVGGTGVALGVVVAESVGSAVFVETEAGSVVGLGVLLGHGRRLWRSAPRGYDKFHSELDG